MIHTYADVVDNLFDFCGGGPGEQVARDCRRAAQEAYSEIVNVHRWPYLLHHGRIITAAPFSGDDDATIGYVHTGGTYERQVTLTGDVWPANARSCYLRLADGSGSTDFVAYRVDQRISDTVLVLDPMVNPGRDIEDGARFVLYQDTYELPADFVAQDEALYELNFGGMQYRPAREWLFENRYILAEGTPQFYTFTGDPQYPGRMVMRVFPWPSESRSIDFVYLRRPRPLFFQEATGGTVSMTSGGTTVTGTGTAFSPAMVGSVIRISGTARKPSSPVGSISGYNPPSVEARIVAWVGPAEVVVDVPAPSDLTSVGYYVTDPIDFEAGTMLNAYLRCAESQLSSLRRLKERADAMGNYRMALNVARSASSVSFAGRCSGPVSVYRPRLADYPQGPDES